MKCASCDEEERWQQYHANFCYVAASQRKTCEKEKVLEIHIVLSAIYFSFILFQHANTCRRTVYEVTTLGRAVDVQLCYVNRTVLLYLFLFFRCGMVVFVVCCFLGRATTEDGMCLMFNGSRRQFSQFCSDFKNYYNWPSMMPHSIVKEISQRFHELISNTFALYATLWYILHKK